MVTKGKGVMEIVDLRLFFELLTCFYRSGSNIQDIPLVCDVLPLSEKAKKKIAGRIYNSVTKGAKNV